MMTIVKKRGLCAALLLSLLLALTACTSVAGGSGTAGAIPSTAPDPAAAAPHSPAAPAPLSLSGSASHEAKLVEDTADFMATNMQYTRDDYALLEALKSIKTMRHALGLELQRLTGVLGSDQIYATACGADYVWERVYD